VLNMDAYCDKHKTLRGQEKRAEEVRRKPWIKSATDVLCLGAQVSRHKFFLLPRMNPGRYYTINGLTIKSHELLLCIKMQLIPKL